MSFEPIQFGKYKLIQPLAQGGMAEIFLAKQQGPAGYEKSVVIKRVLSHYSSNPDFVEMFLDEARLAAQLSHPNVVQIFDFGEVEGAYYLCMEYLRGEDLHTLLGLASRKGRAFPPQVAASVVASACEGLHYAHTLTSDDGQPLNIVHRDISPSNIFVTFQGQVKVLDFGIARAEGKVVKTALGVIKGKLSYMAPEQARGEPLDGRSDVWALGTVLLELLTGKKAFWRSNDVETFQALLQDPIPLPSELRDGIPRELDEICKRALERNVRDRYPSARAMYAELDEFLSSRTYIPAQTLLQQYLQELVGEEAVAARLKGSTASRLPSPPSERAEPAARTPRPRTAATKSGGGIKLSSVEGETKGAPPSSTVVARRKSSQGVPVVAAAAGRSPVVLIAALSGVAVLAVGAAVYFALRRPAVAEPDQPRALVVQVQTVHTDATGAVTVEPAVEPPRAAAAPDAGAVAPPPAVAPVPKPPAKGLLDVNCVPWCAIFIDGKDTTRISPALGIPVTPGKHRLRVVNTPTGIEQEKEILIRAGSTTREVVRF